MKPYTFEDVVAALNAVAPLDWASFFTQRLQSLDAHAPLGGVERSGWKLVYGDEPNDVQAAYDTSRSTIDLRFSLGAIVKDDGTLQDVVPDRPAAQAGLGPGMQLIAVDGRKFSRDVLLDALRLGSGGHAPLELLAANGEFLRDARRRLARGASSTRISSATPRGPTRSRRSSRPRPGAERSATVRYGSSSRSSQARARLHCRRTVRAERPSADAVSSAERPA